MSEPPPRRTASCAVLDDRSRRSDHRAQPLPRPRRWARRYRTSGPLSPSGISDADALGILAEAAALGIPVVVLPFVNFALAARAPYKHSVKSLRSEGVLILFGPGEFGPHAPGLAATGSLISPAASRAQ